MTLPSDGSMATFPNNTVAQFKTLLHVPQTLDFTDGESEVGLTELMYASSVKNISEEEAFFDLLITQEFIVLISRIPIISKSIVFTWKKFTVRPCRNVSP